jgi:replication factor A1
LKLSELRPGMENVELMVELISIEEPRKVTTYSGLEHTLVEGLVKDGSGSMGLTVWNEKIEELQGIEAGNTLKLVDCFITSYKGELSVNVGRDSGIQRK